MADGDGGEFAHYLLGPDAKWIRIANLADHVISGAFGDDGYLYLLSRQQAPKGKVLKLSLSDPQISRAKEIIAESDIALKNIVPGGGSLYLIGVTGGPSEVRIHDRNGVPQNKLPTEPNSAVYQMLRYGEGSMLFKGASYVNPPAWYRLIHLLIKSRPPLCDQPRRRISTILL